jgi:hypothetical protein
LIKVRRERKRREAKNGRLPLLGIELFAKLNLLFGVDAGVEQGVHGVCSLGVPFSEPQEPAIEEDLLERGPCIQGGFFNSSLKHGFSLSALDCDG